MPIPNLRRLILIAGKQYLFNDNEKNAGITDHNLYRQLNGEWTQGCSLWVSANRRWRTPYGGLQFGPFGCIFAATTNFIKEVHGPEK